MLTVIKNNNEGNTNFNEANYNNGRPWRVSGELARLVRCAYVDLHLTHVVF